ncbi:hypothetical protein ACQCVH_12845 [Bacillus infantis]|uniref:hypothetical protein n=1 Tax=Bacillus infantis TaxID=324767 RepID=UPI003CF4B3AE
MPRAKFILRKCPGLAIKEKEGILSKWGGNDCHTYEYFMRGVSSRHTICVYLLFDEDQLAGMISAWKSGFHPFCTYFSMVTATHAGQGAEDVLLNALYSSKEVELPLQTSIGGTSIK